MGRRRFSAGLLAKAGAAAFGLVVSLSSGRAQASSVLEASVVWHGECDERDALNAEIRARGVSFEEGAPGRSPIELAVTVVRDAPGFIAELELVALEGREERTVAARDCGELLRAIAWVLVVFAEERTAAQGRGGAAKNAPAGSSSAAFPEPPSEPAESPQEAPTKAAPPPARAAAEGECRGRGFGVGSDFVAAAGWVPAPTLGATLFARYAPCPSFLPGIEVGAGELVTLGFERDGRELSVARAGMRAVLWMELGTPVVDAGLGLEFSRLRATASDSEAGPGGNDSALWWAVALPVRAMFPLFTRHLWVRAGADALYVPSEYSFRYESGEPLADTGHFEVRGLAGIGGRL
ncbi:MAG TPA: hypothetical protein VFZ53_25945 [Polyangiaceae bacterium]